MLLPALSIVDLINNKTSLNIATVETLFQKHFPQVGKYLKLITK